MYKFDLTNPDFTVGDALICGFEEEIELYLYGRFGD
jgi:hypothetical protein